MKAHHSQICVDGKDNTENKLPLRLVTNLEVPKGGTNSKKQMYGELTGTVHLTRSRYYASNAIGWAMQTFSKE